MSRLETVAFWIQMITVGPYWVWYFKWILRNHDKLFYRLLWVVPTQFISSALVQWLSDASVFWRFISLVGAAWGIHIYRKHKDDDDNDHWWGKKLSQVKMKVVDAGHRLVIVPEPAPIPV